MPLDAPYLVFVDLDGTIVGQVDPQTMRFALDETMKRAGIKAVESPLAPDPFSREHALVRPGLGEWMDAMRKALGGDVHFFVFTASEKKWALAEVPWIERAQGVQFARPVFTRDDCQVDARGYYRKSVASVLPRALRAVAKARGAPVTPAQRAETLARRVLIVDNNPVWSDHTHQLLLCPTYDYTAFEDLLARVPQHARENAIVQKELASLVSGGFLCPAALEGRDPVTRQHKHYKWLASKCRATMRANRPHLDDAFWPLLKRAIVRGGFREFTAESVRSIQDALARMQRRREKEKAREAKSKV